MTPSTPVAHHAEGYGFSDVVWLRVEVEDDGRGVRLDQQSRLFASFQQVQALAAGADQHAALKGTGLGLYIVRALVTRQGGRVGMYSAGVPGQPTVFWFEVPVRVTHAPRRPRASGAALTPATPTGSSAHPSRLVSSADNGGSTMFARVRSSHLPTPRAAVPAAGAASLLSPLPCSMVVATPSDFSEHKSVAIMHTRGGMHVVHGEGAPVAQGGMVWPQRRLSRITTRIHTVADEAPCGAGAVPSRRASPRSRSPHASQTALHVCVVDDSESVRMLVSRAMQRQFPAAVIVECADGAEALAHVRAHLDWREAPPGVRLACHRPVDLVLLDQNMPIMTGLEAAAGMRAAGCGAVIIGVTGNALDTDTFLAAGVDAVMTKPIRAADVVRLVLKHLPPALAAPPAAITETSHVGGALPAAEGATSLIATASVSP